MTNFVALADLTPDRPVLRHGWSADTFLLNVRALGTPIDVNLVGVFNDHPRLARRDEPLPFHRDGIRDDETARRQGGVYVEMPGVDVVGMYCIVGNDDCRTLFRLPDDTISEVVLRPGDAIFWLNTLPHARQGLVGDQLLLRTWISLATAASRPAI